MYSNFPCFGFFSFLAFEALYLTWQSQQLTLEIPTDRAKDLAQPDAVVLGVRVARDDDVPILLGAGLEAVTNIVERIDVHGLP